jgi:hypothetical protein
MSTPVILPSAPEVTRRLIALARTWEATARELWQSISLQDCDGVGAGLRGCVASTHEKDARELRALAAEISGDLP